MSKKRRRKKGKRPGPPPPPSVPQTGPGGAASNIPDDAPPEADASAADRREQALERRRTRERRRRLRYVGIGALVVVVLAGAFAFQSFRSGQEVAEYEALSRDAAGCTEVQGVGGLSREHVEDAVDYETSPPAGGAHSPSSLRSGVYSEPFSDNPRASEATIYQAVHSLEHGYTIIWHAPDLDDDVRGELERVVRDERKTILVPYPDLEDGNALALTAWGRLQRCEEADPEVVREFARTFRERNAPEPQAG